MLPLSEKNAWVASWNAQVALLGISATFKTVAGSTSNIHCGFVKPKNEYLINAYQEEDRICTIRKIDLSVAPAKFDVIILSSGDEYAIKEVHEIHLNDVYLGWKVICQG